MKIVPLFFLALVAGGPVNETDRDDSFDRNALHFLCFSNKLDVEGTRELISSHSEYLFEKDNTGFLPLHYICHYRRERGPEIEEKEGLILDMILTESAKARPNGDKIIIDSVTTNERTPLMIAAMQGKAHLIRKLLAHSPESISLVDEEGNNAFLLAVSGNHVACVKMLLDEFSNSIQDSHNNYGWTAFHIGAYYGSYETIKFLLSYQGNSHLFDPNFKDGTGKKAIDLAVLRGEYEIVTLLGTEPNVEIDQFSASLIAASSLHRFQYLNRLRNVLGLSVLQAK